MKYMKLFNESKLKSSLNIDEINECILHIKDICEITITKGFISVIGDDLEFFIEEIDIRNDKCYEAYDINIWYPDTNLDVYNAGSYGIFYTDINILGKAKELSDAIYDSVNKLKNVYHYNNIYFNIHNLGSCIIIASNEIYEAS